MLKKRIEKSMGVLDRAHFLPHIGSGDKTRTQYQQLCQALDEYTRKTFYEWTQTVERDPMKLLEVPLMTRSVERPGMIDINSDRSLLKLFQEIHYWERLMFEIPHYAADVYTKHEDLRGLREHVLLVVRDYNHIIATLSPEERALFKERIRFLYKKIHPGLTKLTWASKGISDFFVNECRVHASKIQAVVDSHKGANLTIGAPCKAMSERLLVKIDGKKVYEKMEFDEEQRRTRTAVQGKLHALHSDVVRTMKATYEVFRADGAEVKQNWHGYTERVDRMVEEAPRLNVKWSLQELARAINGDGKSGPNPLFKVKVELEDDKVEFSPTLKQLASIVGSIAGQLTHALSDVKRLPDLLTRKKSQKEPIHEVIQAQVSACRPTRSRCSSTCRRGTATARSGRPTKTRPSAATSTSTRNCRAPTRTSRASPRWPTMSRPRRPWEEGEEHKEKFKTGLLAQNEESKKQVSSLVDEFHTKGTFTSTIQTSEALDAVAQIRAQLVTPRRRRWCCAGASTSQDRHAAQQGRRQPGEGAGADRAHLGPDARRGALDRLEGRGLCRG